MSQPTRQEMSSRHRIATAATTLVLPLASLALLSSEAHASGFSTARFGGEHGHPTTTNPTAIYYNPAGIAGSEGIHVFLDGSLAIRSASFLHTQGGNDVDEPADAQGANYGEATLLNVAAAPMIGVSAKFGDFAVGAGFYVPFGGAAVWDKNEAFRDHPRYAGPVDGVQRWWAIDGTIRSSHITLAAGYHIEPARLDIGLSGNLVLSTIDTIRARNSDGSNNVTSEGRSYLDVSGTSFSFGVGAIYEAMPKQLWLGLSYQSRPNVAGGMKLEGTLKNVFGPAEPSEGDIAVTQDMPDIIRLGARFRATDAIELRLFGDLTRWSAFKDQCIAVPENECEVNEDGSEVGAPGTVTQNIPRRWNDAFGVRAGLSYFATESAEIFSGLGYDGNAVPDEMLETGLLDFEKFSVALGGRFRLAEPLHLGLSYTHIFYIQREITNSELDTYVAPSVVPNANGIYDQTVGVINANVELQF